jgi:hemerythrin-like domain-containing protein
MTRQHVPADTRMMGVVHDALRRDLARAVDALSTTAAPDDGQRAAIAGHIEWLMHFLHLHHHGEDAGLWPLVRECDPRGAQLLDAMAADHARVAPLADACEDAARDYGARSTDDARVGLRDALQRLAETLLPHLEREEREVMPIVSLAITDGEWRSIDHQYFVAPKSFTELGFEGHWLLDGLDAERSRVVVHQVPALPRVILVHGFARRYRRHALACWGPGSYGPQPPSPRRIPRSGGAEVVVAAPIDAVWRVAADVTRVGEWSHECRRVEWVGEATAPAPGVRFVGMNKAGPWSWSRVNEVVCADEPSTLVWRTISTRWFPDSSEWRLRLKAVDGGTRIAESYEALRSPAFLARAYSFVVPAHRDRTRGLAEDLQRLGAIAAREALAMANASQP